jgi:hypothetical protein
VEDLEESFVTDPGAITTSAAHQFVTNVLGIKAPSSVNVVVSYDDDVCPASHPRLVDAAITTARHFAAVVEGSGSGLVPARALNFRGGLPPHASNNAMFSVALTRDMSSQMGQNAVFFGANSRKRAWVPVSATVTSRRGSGFPAVYVVL